MQGIGLFAWLCVFLAVLIHRYQTEQQSSAIDAVTAAGGTPVTATGTSVGAAGDGNPFQPITHVYDPNNRVILFFSIPLPGHLSPLLIQGLHLARRGWTVVVSSNEQSRGVITGFISQRFTAAGGVNSTANGGSMEFLSIGTCEETTGSDGETASLPAAALSVLSLGDFWAQQSREPSFPVTAGVIADQLMALHPCLYQGLLRAMKKRFALPPATATASTAAAPPAPAYRYPALMVVDLFTVSGMDVARTLGIPFTVNNADLLYSLSPFNLPVHDTEPGMFTAKSRHDVGDAFSERVVYPVVRVLLVHLLLIPAQERNMNYYRSLSGLPPLDWIRHMQGRLVITNTAFGLEYARPLPPSVVLSGPMILEDPLLPGESDAAMDWIGAGAGRDLPVVFVSFGTLVHLDERQLKELAAGLRSEHYRVIWKLKHYKSLLSGDVIAELTSPAAGSKLQPVLLTEWVPSQLRLLADSRVRVFLSHCGINSAHESAYYGTALLCIPFFGDQMDMAWRVTDAGMGLALSKLNFTGSELQDSIRTILNSPGFEANAARVQHLVRGAVGAVGASGVADILESHIRFGIAHLRMAEMSFGYIQYYGLDVTAVYILMLVAMYYVCQLCCCSRCCTSNDHYAAANDNNSGGGVGSGGGGGGASGAGKRSPHEPLSPNSPFVTAAGARAYAEQKFR